MNEKPSLRLFRRLSIRTSALLIGVMAVIGASMWGRDANRRSPVTESNPLLPPSSNSPARPRSTLTELEHDFGIVHPKSRQLHRFELRNTSSGTWNVKEIRVTCGCTLATTPTQVIAPGELGLFDVQYTAPGGRHDESKSIEVAFQEPEAPRVTLRIRACVHDKVDFAPRSLHFRVQPTRVAVARTILDIGTTLPGPIHVNSTPTWLFVEQTTESSTHHGGHAWYSSRLSIVVDASSLAPGLYHDKIDLTVVDSACSVPVTFDVAEPIVVAPSRLLFGQLGRGQQLGKRVVFSFSDAVPPHPTLIEVEHDLGARLDYEWIHKSGHLLSLNVRLSPSIGDTSISGSLVLRFPDNSTITIPISATVRKVAPLEIEDV